MADRPKAKDFVMSIEAMKQALEALEKLWNIIDDIDTYGDMAKSDDKLYRSLVERRQRQRFEQTGISTDGYELNGGAITSLRQAIAEAKKQEPVACIGYWNQKTGAYYKPDQISTAHQKLIEDGILRRCYTTPPQRKPLTDEQARAMWPAVTLVATQDIMKFVRAIEAAHGIKE